jgi:hypothetical protein
MSGYALTIGCNIKLNVTIKDSGFIVSLFSLESDSIHIYIITDMLGYLVTILIINSNRKITIDHAHHHQIDS